MSKEDQQSAEELKRLREKRKAESSTKKRPRQESCLSDTEDDEEVSTTATSSSGTISGKKVQQKAKDAQGRKKIPKKPDAQIEAEKAQRAANALIGDGKEQAKSKRLLSAANRKQTDSEACGAFCLTGCKDPCQTQRVHRWDPAAQRRFYNVLTTKKLKIRKGLRGVWADELNDLRNRHPSTLTPSERDELKAMQEQPFRVKETDTLKVSAMQQRELALLNANLLAADELQGESLTIEDRIRKFEEDTEQEILDLVEMKAKELRAEKKWMNDEIEAKIADPIRAEMAITIAKMRAKHERVMGPCYLQQEKNERFNESETSLAIQHHRYGVVPPESLGPYTDHLDEGHLTSMRKLALNLNRQLHILNENRTDRVVGYNCRFCHRSLYIPRGALYQQASVLCRKCLSVMYCNHLCRSSDAFEHAWSCFKHPAWECDEARRQREVADPSVEAEEEHPEEELPQPDHLDYQALEEFSLAPGYPSQGQEGAEGQAGQDPQAVIVD